VQDAGVVEEGRGRARPEDSPGQVRVLSARDREGLLVEAADPLDEGARVDHVAGLEMGARAGHLERARERPAPLELVRARLRPPLEDGVGMARRAAQGSREPVGIGDAVVVGEGDQRRSRCPPARVAGRGRAGRRVEPQRAQLQGAFRLGVLQDPGRRVSRAVVDRDDLELTRRERLAAQRIEQLGQPLRPVVGGEDGGDLRPAALHPRQR
jgi:hypothetical protein